MCMDVCIYTYLYIHIYIYVYVCVYHIKNIYLMSSNESVANVPGAPDITVQNLHPKLLCLFIYYPFTGGSFLVSV